MPRLRILNGSPGQPNGCASPPRLRCVAIGGTASLGRVMLRVPQGTRSDRRRRGGRQPVLWLVRPPHRHRRGAPEQDPTTTRGPLPMAPAEHSGASGAVGRAEGGRRRSRCVPGTAPAESTPQRLESGRPSPERVTRAGAVLGTAARVGRAPPRLRPRAAAAARRYPLVGVGSSRPQPGDSGAGRWFHGRTEEGRWST